MTQRSKRLFRRAVDRVAMPYVEQVLAASATAEPASPAGTSMGDDGDATSTVPSDFFHNMLHELRTIELERLRGPYERVVSVGASGRWYFDWFERSVGQVREHIGVEAFEPEPADLPAYVRWVPTTADRFDGLADDETDMVFAGQTTEHLWSDELAAFLLQARRVLRGSGHLVLDSPNRLVTEHLDWSHGGHTVELSPGEISELVQLAGFEVESLRGVWGCRVGGELVQLEDRLDESSLLVRRIVDGPDHPDDCFVWWLVARPSGAPDPDVLRARVDELYARHWPTRVCRGMWPGPSGDLPEFAPGTTTTLRSLPFMLRPGSFTFGLQLEAGDIAELADARLTLVLPGGHAVHDRGLSEASVDSSGVWWSVEQVDLMFALSIELSVTAGDTAVRVAMPLVIEPEGG